MACGSIAGSTLQRRRLLSRRSLHLPAGQAMIGALALSWLLVGCGEPLQLTRSAEPGASQSLDGRAAPTESISEPEATAWVAVPGRELDRTEALIAIEAAQSAPAVVIARDEAIVLPSGDTWEFTARVARTSSATAACTENLGSSQACRVLPTTLDGPLILGYGGAPIPVVEVWSRNPFGRIEVLLADGRTATSTAVITDGGTFAAIPFSAQNRPLSLSVHSDHGDFDLGLAEFVGDDAELAVAGASY